MKKTLILKFSLCYILFLIICFVFISVFSAGQLTSYLVNDQAEKLRLEASSIAENLSSSSSEGASSMEIQAISSYLKASIWITDTDGLILSDSDRDFRKNTLIPGFDELRSTESLYVISDLGYLSSENITVLSPVIRNFETVGFVVLSYPMAFILNSQYRILNILYISFTGISLFSLILIIFFIFCVLHPINLIIKGASKYAAGDFSARIKISSHDEIGYLSETLNFMAGELERADESQKRFITNLSHDFRSPLTSIKGYLEAILDGTIELENADRYLERMIKETERLSNMTNSILTLDSADRLNRTVFDINKMIRAVCQTFELKCRNKNISFDLSFSDRKLFVKADFQRIEQVLYNLFDNAVKFSSPGSKISVSSYPKGQKVFVSVKDYGIGIPKKDIARIWDRFYKADLSRGKDRQGSGLGLSIVKSIILSHNETIDCVSTEGAGTEFTFSLPYVDFKN